MASKETVKQLNADIARLSSEAKAIHADIKTKSNSGANDYTGRVDDLAKLDAVLDAGMAKRDELAREQKELALDEVTEAKNEEREEGARSGRRVKSLGEQVLETDQFKEGQKQRKMDVVEIERKDHFESGVAGAEGGRLVWSDRRDNPLLKPTRPLSVLDVLPTLPTNSNLVEYVVETSYTEGAAVVAEKAVKPQSDIRFALQSAKVATIAHYVVVTEQLMEDAPRFRAIIDGRLGDGVLRKLEDLIIGSTTGDIVGLLASAGLTRAKGVASNGLGGTADENPFDTIRFAITDLVLKFYRPDTIVLNPILSARFDTAKDTQGRYLMSFDPIIKRLWNLRPTEAAGTLIPGDTALVLDSQRSATIYDRGVRRIQVGWFNDLFIRNQYAIRGEGRYALAVEFPEGINKVTDLDEVFVAP